MARGLFLTEIRRFRACNCLAGVRGSRTHLPRSSRGITDLKCVATPGVKWCHVLQCVDFEAKTSPNLVPFVAKWWDVWPHLGDIWATFRKRLVVDWWQGHGYAGDCSDDASSQADGHVIFTASGIAYSARISRLTMAKYKGW